MNEKECMCCGGEFTKEFPRSIDKELCTYCYDDVVDFADNEPMISMTDLY